MYEFSFEINDCTLGFDESAENEISLLSPFMSARFPPSE
jgi:hypothetical protein